MLTILFNQGWLVPVPAQAVVSSSATGGKRHEHREMEQYYQHIQRVQRDDREIVQMISVLIDKL